MAWTEQQIQTLKKMWGNGYSASDIARSLGGGVTRNAVIGKAHRLKLSVGAGVSGRQLPEAPSKTVGVVMTSITKISGKKRPALRAAMPAPMPTKPHTDTLAKLLAHDAIHKPLDMIKRTEGIPVIKAGEHHCRWPVGDPRSPDFRFCGGETFEGLPYCLQHARIAYQTLGRKTRANANIERALSVEQTVVAAPEATEKKED